MVLKQGLFTGTALKQLDLCVTLLRQDIHLQSEGQGTSLVMSCLPVNFFQNYYLEKFDAFHKSADGIYSHRASVRT